MKANASQTVTYSRGAVTVSIAATLGQSLLKLSDAFDNRIEWTDADFLIVFADLVAAFAAVGLTFLEPARGDKVAVTRGSAINLYEVLAPGAEPPWRWSDPNHTIVRCHGKYVGNA